MAEKVSSSNGIEQRPKLRFPGFDEPWVQVILGSRLLPYCEVTTENNQYPPLTSSRKGLFLQTEYFNRQVASEDNTGYNIVPYGYFTYRHMSDDLTFYFNINEIVDKGMVSTLYPVFTTTEDLNGHFLKIYLNYSNRFASYCVLQKQGGSRTYMYFKKLCAHYAVIPMIEEQQKIAGFIDLLDKRITLQADMIERLKKYKRGVNIDLISSIDDSQKMALGNICTITGGGTPDTSNFKFWDGEIDWFTPSEIGKSKYVEHSNRKITQSGLTHSSAKKLPKGTILLTTRATLGEMSIATHECTTNQGFQSLIPNTDHVTHEYLYYLQVLIIPWCEKYASGNTFREISKASLSKCLVPIPDKEEQEKIVRILAVIDKRIVKTEEVLQKLLNTKLALLQQIFI